MRRIVTICLAFVLSSVLVKAQELIQGSFEPLMNARVVTVQLDLSQAYVEGAHLEDFLGLMSFEDGAKYQAAFQKDLRDILADFIDEFNDTNCPILLTVSPNPDTVMTIQVKEISRKELYILRLSNYPQSRQQSDSHNHNDFQRWSNWLFYEPYGRCF